MMLKRAVKYLKESRNFIYGSFFLFFLCAILGFSFAGSLDVFDNYINEIIDKTEGLSLFGLIEFIFLNNLKSSFFALILGALFGIFPVFVAVLNGLILGYVMQKVWLVSGFLDFWRLLPHGIFELPAVFISIGLGIKLGMALFSKRPMETFKVRFIESMIVFGLIILPLLIIAAAIEGLLIVLA